MSNSLHNFASKMIEETCRIGRPCISHFWGKLVYCNIVISLIVHKEEINFILKDTHKLEHTLTTFPQLIHKRSKSMLIWGSLDYIRLTLYLLFGGGGGAFALGCRNNSLCTPLLCRNNAMLSAHLCYAGTKHRADLCCAGTKHSTHIFCAGTMHSAHLCHAGIMHSGYFCFPGTIKSAHLCCAEQCTDHTFAVQEQCTVHTFALQE